MKSKLSLKTLLEISISELKDLTTVTKPDFRLEQAEYNKQTDEWEIVVSYLVENINKRVNPLGLPISEFPYHRIYKMMKINSQQEIIGMYMFNNKE